MQDKLKSSIDSFIFEMFFVNMYKFESHLYKIYIKAIVETFVEMRKQNECLID